MKIIFQGNYAQKLYDYQIGLGTDKAVSAAILSTLHDLIQNAVNIPTGEEFKSVKTDHKADSKKAFKDVKKLYSAQGTSTTSLVLLGEDHASVDDKDRATYFINEINSGNLTPDVVIFERGMAYSAPFGVHVIRESNLTTVTGGDFGMGLSRKQRSMVVGGYLALIVASGSQLDSNKCLIFFGENHKDIFTYFEYFARHTAGYVEKETRNLFFVRSYVN